MWQDHLSREGDIMDPFDPLAGERLEVSVQQVSGDRARVVCSSISSDPFWVPSSSLESFQKGGRQVALARRILRGEPLASLAKRVGVPAEKLRAALYSRAQLGLGELIERSLPKVFTLWGMSDTNSYWSGSGFSFNSQGQILTCAHVTDPENAGYSRRDMFARNRDHQGRLEVIALDSDLDLAVGIIEQLEPSSYLPLGDSSEMVPGEQILALGSPEGIDQVVTVGYLATESRELNGASSIFIDVDIFPGSSGGPVLAMDGTVIGIAQGTVSSRGGMGLNYVIPSDQGKIWLKSQGLKYE